MDKIQEIRDWMALPEPENGDVHEAIQEAYTHIYTALDCIEKLEAVREAAQNRLLGHIYRCDALLENGKYEDCDCGVKEITIALAALEAQDG